MLNFAAGILYPQQKRYSRTTFRLNLTSNVLKNSPRLRPTREGRTNPGRFSIDCTGNPQGALATGPALRTAHFCRHRMVALAPTISGDHRCAPIQAAWHHIESTTVVIRL